MQRKDDRTEAQQQTHTILVVGTDRFLSGWGAAKGGLSYAAWACTWEQADTMRQRIAGRTDMMRVRTVIDKPGNRYAPKAPCKHLHIYVADAEEPHHPDCPATDGFGCRCNGVTLEEK